MDDKEVRWVEVEAVFPNIWREIGIALMLAGIGIAVILTWMVVADIQEHVHEIAEYVELVSGG